jgi:hypothetical protein
MDGSERGTEYVALELERLYRISIAFGLLAFCRPRLPGAQGHSEASQLRAPDGHRKGHHAVFP